SFTKLNIFSSFKAVGVSPFNPNVILDKFIDSDSKTTKDSNSNATIYKGEYENEGLIDALTTKRKREKQGKPLALL
ncbi:hypothetical protein BU23DRAFT_514616, partial [Bimuria novae-zelandiae CBS 107.79]